MKAWGEYAQFMKNMMAQNVAKSTKNIIFTAHTSDIFNESEMVNETLPPEKVCGPRLLKGYQTFVIWRFLLFHDVCYPRTVGKNAQFRRIRKIHFCDFLSGKNSFFAI